MQPLVILYKYKKYKNAIIYTNYIGLYFISPHVSKSEIKFTNEAGSWNFIKNGPEENAYRKFII